MTSADSEPDQPDDAANQQLPNAVQQMGDITKAINDITNVVTLAAQLTSKVITVSAFNLQRRAFSPPSRLLAATAPNPAASCIVDRDLRNVLEEMAMCA